MKHWKIHRICEDVRYVTMNRCRICMTRSRICEAVKYEKMSVEYVKMKCKDVEHVKM